MQLNQSFYFSMESLFKDLTDVPGAVERFKTIYENTKLEGYSYFVIAGLSLLLNLPQVHPDYPALQLFLKSPVSSWRPWKHYNSTFVQSITL